MPYPLSSGGRIRSYYLLRNLAGGHEVHLLAFSHDGEPIPVPLRDLCRSVEAVPAPVRREGRVQRVLRLLRSPDDIIMGRHSEEMERRLEAHLERGGWNLVVLDDMGTASYIRKTDRCPVLLSKHNCEWELLRRHAKLKARRPLAWLLSRMEAHAARRSEARATCLADRVIVVSDTDRQALLGMCPSAGIDVVPNGVDTEYFRPAAAGPGNRVLFSGALFWYPNIDAVIWFCESVWPLIRRRVVDVHFDVVGSEPPRIVRELDELPGVSVVADVPDVRSYLARSKVCVVPLRIGSGTRLKIMEAMASGRPVVSTSVGIEGLALKVGEEIVVADHAVSFADACVELLRDNAKQRALGRAGLVAALERFDWSVALDSLNRICEETAEGKGKR